MPTFMAIILILIGACELFTIQYEYNLRKSCESMDMRLALIDDKYSCIALEVEDELHNR